MTDASKFVPIALCGVVLAGAFTGKATHAETAADVLKSGLAHCAVISVRDDRLACFDALADTAAPLVQPPAQSDTPEDFGLSPAQKPPPKTSAIAARVTSLSRDKDGAVVVNLDNGQSWTLDQADPLLASGDAIIIRRAAMGSFMLTTPTRRVHRVRRVLHPAT